MTRRAILASLTVFLLNTPAGAQQAPAGPPAVRSPEVGADRRVTFRLAAPRATEVKVTCECVKDAVAMQKDDKGVWSATVGPVAPDIYEYEFWLDDVQVIDPRNPWVKYNGRPAPASSLLEVLPHQRTEPLQEPLPLPLADLSHVGAGEPQRRCDLRGGQPRAIAEADHVPLAVG